MKKYIIRNTRGEIMGAFIFNPLDGAMIQRFVDTFQDKEAIVKMLEPLRNISMDSTGSAQTIKDRLTLRKVEKAFKESFDYVFGAGAYKSFFTSIHPFATHISGGFYCMQVFEAISKVVCDEFEKVRESL